MPYLTAAHACARVGMAERAPTPRALMHMDGKVPERESQKSSSVTRFEAVKMLNAALYVNVRAAECSLKQQIDISDSASISEVSVFTLLNAQ